MSRQVEPQRCKRRGGGRPRTISGLLRAALALAALAGCARTAPPPAPAADPSLNAPPAGVTANSGGDTRGTVLYQPAPPPGGPRTPPNPYAPVSDKFVIAQRQRMAWALAEIDLHAHQQAENAYPVPPAGATRASKQAAIAQAERQAGFNAYLLEKYDARFCNQFHVSYDQLVLIIRESRGKNWPLPSAPE